MKDFTARQPRLLSYQEQEYQCERLFSSREPFFHLCTPGDAAAQLFENEADFRFAMNLVAFCTHLIPDMIVITFEVMRNHIHLVGEGTIERGEEWFSQFRRRLLRYYQSIGRVLDLNAFKADIFPIGDLSFLRNTIAYVNRNGYVVHPYHTPFSYPWGANRFYFNPDARLRTDGVYGDLTFRQKRDLFFSHSIEYPANHFLVDGYISPVSYCQLDLGEGVFRDARHYFSYVSRNVEAYRDIAKLLGDSVFYTDDELYTIVRQLCRDRYGSSRPETLTMDAKQEMARLLHFDYKAGNKQIMRMLRLEERTVTALFGR